VSAFLHTVLALQRPSAMSSNLAFAPAWVSASPKAPLEVVRVNGASHSPDIRHTLSSGAAGKFRRPDSTAALVGTSFFVAARSLRSTRAAAAKGKRQQRDGGVAVLDRNSDTLPAGARKPSMPPSKKKDPKRPAKVNSAAVVAEEHSRADPPITPTLSIPEGATTRVNEEGKKVLFAGGLIGGQGVFSNADHNFDPLGLSEKLPFMLPFFRESELKHGRLAMLGFLGLIAPDAVGPIPGFSELLPKCAAAGKGGELRVVEAHSACMADQLPVIGISPMMLILLAAGTIEVVTSAQKVALGWGLTTKNAGDYPGRQEIGGFLKQLPDTETEMVIRKLQELKHGRLAMLAFSGAWAQGVLTANGFPWIW